VEAVAACDVGGLDALRIAFPVDEDDPGRVGSRVSDLGAGDVSKIGWPSLTRALVKSLVISDCP
jgi:hypothetical protein